VAEGSATTQTTTVTPDDTCVLFHAHLLSWTTHMWSRDQRKETTRTDE